MSLATRESARQRRWHLLWLTLRQAGDSIVDYAFCRPLGGDPDLLLVRADGRELPFPDHRFDLTFQGTMLSSVLDPGHRETIAAEMRRVTRPGGLILWYDMRVTRPDNREVTAVGPREARAFSISVVHPWMSSQRCSPARRGAL